MTTKEHIEHLTAIAQDLHELHFDILSFNECLNMAIEVQKSKTLERIDDRLLDLCQELAQIGESIHSISQSIEN